MPHSVQKLSWVVFLFVQLTLHYVRGYSHPLNLCYLTRESMVRGMGGSHQTLGYKLTASGTTIELEPPESNALKGFFLFATDEDGNAIGTWDTSSSGFQPVSSASCRNGAITHSDATIKSLSVNPSFQLTMPSGIDKATVKAFAVHSKTVWEELEPIQVSTSAKSNENTSGHSKVKKSGNTKNNSNKAVLLSLLSILKVSLGFLCFYLFF